MAINLKSHYSAQSVNSELQAILGNMDSHESAVVLEYVSSWFDSFFEGNCTVEDFIEEISKLSDTDISKKLIEFIEAQVQQLKEAAETNAQTHEQSHNESTPSKAQTIHDRIKKKETTDSTQQNKQQETQISISKKNTKLIEKDQQKILKAKAGVDPADDDQSLLSGLENKKPQRCRYYPACKNEKTCPFMHPTEPCPFFPKCKFGNQCMNKHPECKFGKSCTRMDCFYEHPFPTMNPVMQMYQMLNMSLKRTSIPGSLTRPTQKKTPAGDDATNIPAQRGSDKLDE